jgi:hypothetical protein
MRFSTARPARALFAILCPLFSILAANAFAQSRTVLNNPAVQSDINMSSHKLTGLPATVLADWGITDALDTATLNTALANYVLKTTTVNGHALSANVTVGKGDVGLGNADNTSDANKPVSTAQAAADTVVANAAAAALSSHTGNTSNPHGVTKSQVALGNADNTSDANKPVSTATQTALDLKQPLDADLTALAALATDSFGRDLLTKTTAASIRTYIGAGTSSFDGVFASLTSKPTTIGGYGITDFNSLGDARWQPLDSDLTSWAAITRASGFDTFTATPSSANLRTAITDENGTGALLFSGATDALFTTPKITTALKDANGNTILAFSPGTTPVNYLALSNAATGSHPTFTATGSDTHIGVTFTLKGAGTFNIGPNVTFGGTDPGGSDNAFVCATGQNIGLEVVAHGFDQDDLVPMLQVTGHRGVSSGGVFQVFDEGNAYVYGLLQTQLGVQIFGATSGSTILQAAAAAGTTTITLPAATTTLLGANAIGSTVQAFDADLTIYAGITPSTNVQTLLGAANFSAFRSSLGIAIGTDVQAFDSDLTTWASITPAAGVGTFLGTPTLANLKTALTDETTAGWNLFSLANPGAITFLQINADNTVTAQSASAQRTALSLVIGTNVEAWDADLDTYAANTPTTVGLNIVKLTNPSAISFVKIAADNSVSSRTPAQVKSDLTLDNLDNTSDVNKPVSTAQQTAIDGKLSDTAFASSWNAVTTIAPSKNAVYDWAHTFDTDDNGKVNVLDIGGGIPKTDSGGGVSVATAGTDYLTPATAPFVVVAKSVTVLTAGTPADIATITLPAGVTRWRLGGGNTVGTAGGTIITETASGTLAAAAFTAFDATGGGGVTLTASGNTPASAVTAVGWQMVSAASISTSSTITIRQTANSANSGTASFYLLITPVL